MLICRSVILVVILIASGCGRFLPNRSVVGGINRATHDGSSTHIDLAKLTDFEWDRLFIFGPYSYPERMCRDIGFSKSECEAANLKNVDEGEYLLVFLNGRKVIRMERYSRLDGSVDKNGLAIGLTPKDALFSIERRIGGIYLTHIVSN